MMRRWCIGAGYKCIWYLPSSLTLLRVGDGCWHFGGRLMNESAINCCSGRGERVCGSSIDGWPGMDEDKTIQNGRWLFFL